MSEKPIGVMPLCIIAIFLGIMGVLGGGVGIIGLLVQPKSSPPPNPKLAEAHAQFERRMQELTRETRPGSLALVPAVILTSGLLLAAGIAGVKLQGLTLLKIAFLSNLIVDVLAGIFGFIVQYKSLAMMKDYLRESTAASGGSLPGVEFGMQFGLYTGIFFGVFWMALKLVYYIIGLVYWNKRPIADAFSGRPVSEQTA